MKKQTNELELTLKNETFQNFFTKLSRMAENKFDIVRPASMLNMTDGKLVVDMADKGISKQLAELGVAVSGDYQVDLNEVAVNHLSDKMGIQRTYAKRMQEKIPSLYDYNVNQWLQYEKEQGDKMRNFFIRTYKQDEGGIGRAFLSNSYKPIDNFDVLKVAAKAIMRAGSKNGIKIDVDTCSLTEKKMYIRFVVPQLLHKINNLKNYKNPETLKQSDGNIVSGFVLSNSEVGHGQLSIAPSIFVDACSNGVVWYNESWNKKHLGAKMDSGVVSWSKETTLNNSKLIMSQIGDVVAKFMDKDFIGKKVEQVTAAMNTKLDNPIDFVTNFSKHCGISEEDTNDVLNYFAKQGSTSSVFDGVQAVTFFAQKQGEDERFALEAAAVDGMVKSKKFDIPVAEYN